MSGLKVVDDLTFTVELAAPFSSFVAAVGYTAFAPLPEVVLRGHRGVRRSCRSATARSRSTSYEPEVAINLTAYEDYAGDDKPVVKDVQFKIYADLRRRLRRPGRRQPRRAGETCRRPRWPATRTRPTWATATSTRRSGVVQYDHVPAVRPEVPEPRPAQGHLRWPSTARRSRRTSSTAPASPATSWVSPVVEGYQEGACGECCEYDPAAAKALLEPGRWLRAAR